MAFNYSDYKDPFPEEYSLKHKISSDTEKQFYHIHEQFEILLLLSDHITFFVDNSSFIVHKNTLLLFNHLNLHFAFQNHPGTVFERYVLYFQPQFVNSLSTRQTNLLNCFYYRPFQDSCVLPLTESETRELISIFDKMILHEADYPDSYGSDIYPKLMISEALLTINQIYQRHHNIIFEENPESLQDIFNILEYIHHHYQEDISLEYLMKKFYISRSRLCSDIRRATGMSPNQYLIHCRLSQAKAMLIKGFSVDEVCGYVGYHSLSHFSRSFKSNIGLSPKKYQAIHRQE